MAVSLGEMEVFFTGFLLDLHSQRKSSIFALVIIWLTMYNALYTTNFFSILNDNYQKMLGMLIVTSWVESEYKPLVISIAGAALVLPYIFCSPLANRAAQKWGKIRVIRFCKLLEFPIVFLGVIGFLLKDPSLISNQQDWITPVSVVLVILAIFLMGLQSAMYSPAKYGLIRDIGGIDNVSKGMGGMESVSFLGMLLGTALAIVAVMYLSPIGYSALLVVFAAAGYVACLFIRAKEINSFYKERLNPFAYMKETHHLALQYKGLNSIIYILSVFWWFATTIQLSLIVYCQEELGLTDGEPGIILCIAAIGMSLGCVISGQIGNKRHDEIMRTPIYGLLIAIGLLIMFNMPAERYVWFTVVLFFVGLMGGFFKVPMDAVIQRTVKPEELNSILAYFNQVSFLFMLGASFTYYGLTLILPLRYVFIMMSVVMLLAGVAVVVYYPPVRILLSRSERKSIKKSKDINKQHTN